MVTNRVLLTEFQFYILVALADAGKDGLHGYGILQSIEEITKGLRKYALPSLYESIRVLASLGLLELDREASERGRLRKYYKITASGHKSLLDHQRELESIRYSVRQTLTTLRPVRS